MVWNLIDLRYIATEGRLRVICLVLIVCLRLVRRTLLTLHFKSILVHLLRVCAHWTAARSFVLVVRILAFKATLVIPHLNLLSFFSVCGAPCRPQRRLLIVAIVGQFSLGQHIALVIGGLAISLWLAVAVRRKFPDLDSARETDWLVQVEWRRRVLSALILLQVVVAAAFHLMNT